VLLFEALGGFGGRSVVLARRCAPKSKMTLLRQKIAQTIMAGCAGETVTPAERLIFTEYGFGGFILFRRNCCEPRQLVALCRTLWETAPGAPPFLAIDQEGGKVHRLPAPFTRFPPAAVIGRRRDPALAQAAGSAVAAELALAGINLNFAPVLDVNSNPDSPIIGDRAFADDPGAVSEIGLAWARGLRAGGVIPCGKHFPGHGGTAQDSHFTLPVVDRSREEISTTELLPFADACRSGLEALMTAHVKFTALDPTRVATLSEAIVTGILRHELGYNGVVFSDDMEMKAISGQHSPGPAAALALQAGVDIVIFCHDADRAVAALEFLCAEAEREPLLRAKIESANRRIGELKRTRLQRFTGTVEDEIEAHLSALEHHRLVEKIYGSL
jgi:beta-N-acetylhexosaminidase